MSTVLAVVAALLIAAALAWVISPFPWSLPWRRSGGTTGHAAPPPARAGLSGPMPVPLTRQDVEEFARRVAEAFPGDQGASQAMAELFALADRYQIPYRR